MDAARHITGGSILLFQEVIQDSLCGLVFDFLAPVPRHCRSGSRFRIDPDVVRSTMPSQKASSLFQLPN